jgi:hypothetical protein
LRDPIAKTQAIRVLDVAAIGPATVWAGALLVRSRPALGWFLMASGVATVVYNYRNLRLEWGRSQDV